MDRTTELRFHLEASPTMRLVPLAGHVVSQRFGRVFGSQDGLTGSGAAVLGVLGWGAGRTPEVGTPGRATHAELARRCMITPATLTGVVNTLVRAGYLRREPDAADRRVVWLALTESGERRVAEISRQLRAMHNPVLSALSAEDEAVVRSFLVNVILEFSATGDPAAVPPPYRLDTPRELEC